jgi:hypothetical protein
MKTQIISLADLTDDDQKSLQFLLDRADQSKEHYELLGYNQALQYPANLAEHPVPESEDTEERGHLDEPESPSDFWLDLEATVQSLELLNYSQIYHNLATSLPFITLQTLEEQILLQYIKIYQSDLVEVPLIAEYLRRFFASIANSNLETVESVPLILGQLPITYNQQKDQFDEAMDFVLHVRKNKFNQLVVSAT